jgi:hypothetical protein
MERAGRIIARWRASGNGLGSEELAAAAWRVAAGAKIAAHTRYAMLVRRHLVIEVEDDLWRRQLLPLRNMVMKNLDKVLGEGIVEDIELRVATPRKGPRQEQEVAQLPPRKAVERDEADGISDPVLKMLFKASRKKETA